MSTQLLLLQLAFLCFASVAWAAPPRKSLDVPFGRNYVPTWASDHIKYFNGGTEIHLVLDKSTGIFMYEASYILLAKSMLK